MLFSLLAILAKYEFVYNRQELLLGRKIDDSMSQEGGKNSPKWNITAY